ncbi:MAG: hypothetical protein ACRYGG_20950 [Janthinobacterium lividum]
MTPRYELTWWQHDDDELAGQVDLDVGPQDVMDAFGLHEVPVNCLLVGPDQVCFVERVSSIVVDLAAYAYTVDAYRN